MQILKFFLTTKITESESNTESSYDHLKTKVTVLRSGPMSVKSISLVVSVSRFDVNSCHKYKNTDPVEPRETRHKECTFVIGTVFFATESSLSTHKKTNKQNSTSK